VTLKTGVMILKIQLCITENYKTVILNVFTVTFDQFNAPLLNTFFIKNLLAPYYMFL